MFAFLSQLSPLHMTVKAIWTLKLDFCSKLCVTVFESFLLFTENGCITRSKSARKMCLEVSVYWFH